MVATLPQESSLVPFEPQIPLVDDDVDDEDDEVKCLELACGAAVRGELCTGLLRFNEELNLGNGLANCMLGVCRVLFILALLRC